MEKNNHDKVFLIPLLGLSLLFPLSSALAVCPICTVAVGAGLGITRWLGIDDSIAGLWIGGLTVSVSAWTISWFEKKKIRFWGRTFFTTLAYYLMVVASLYYMGALKPLDIIAGNMDKLSLGIIVGSFGFLFGAEAYEYMKERNGGHAYFPFQKVVMPLAPLVITSIIFYYLTI
jgi:hypothetical protein